MQRALASVPGRTLLLALLLGAPGLALAAPGPRLAQTAPVDMDAALAQYQQQMAAYTAAREAYEEVAGPYWAAITEKRRLRVAKRRDRQPVDFDDYVLTQPPTYTGPKRPVDPLARPEEAPQRAYVPVVADFLEAAATHYKFVPQRPRDELEYKRAYAQAAAAAGLTRDQIVRVYVFECGGNGKYDLQAGLEYRADARAISSALGYNQLLHINSVSLLAERGDGILKSLHAKAARLTGADKTKLEHKIAIVKRMITASRTVPRQWSQHEKLAKTPQGYGMHALVLDVDVGPLLQTQKLLDSVVFAQRHGMERPLTAAELEMMNLTGDGNGIDMVMMPAEMRTQVPTSNFFQRNGYERNPVAIRNNTVAKLLAATDAKMDRETNAPGAKDLAAAYPR
ncbi:MAG: hypothetical protein JWN71_3299 [Xanthobacteraceae bacterium]|nr:hypothetical protein [Xanthobacteraceae bacterium]